jgi:hypothetical protein
VVELGKEFGRCWNDNLETLVKRRGEAPFAPRIYVFLQKNIVDI